MWRRRWKRPSRGARQRLLTFGARRSATRRAPGYGDVRQAGVRPLRPHAFEIDSRTRLDPTSGEAEAATAPLPARQRRAQPPSPRALEDRASPRPRGTARRRRRRTLDARAARARRRSGGGGGARRANRWPVISASGSVSRDREVDRGRAGLVEWKAESRRLDLLQLVENRAASRGGPMWPPPRQHGPTSSERRRRTLAAGEALRKPSPARRARRSSPDAGSPLSHEPLLGGAA